MTKKTVLLLVDVQNDFCPGGTLAVPEGDRIIPPLNALIRRCREKSIPIIATRDWHPPDHCSFKKNGGPWPEHCVQGTPGAAFHPGLVLDLSHDTIISKAVQRERDAYSGFEDTDLRELLRKEAAQILYIGGLATDYCVKATALDALKEGFQAFVVTDGIRGVEVQLGDTQRALEAMQKAGAVLISSEEAARDLSPIP